jgi:hypothetical protein
MDVDRNTDTRKTLGTWDKLMPVDSLPFVELSLDKAFRIFLRGNAQGIAEIGWDKTKDECNQDSPIIYEWFKKSVGEE